MQDFTIKNPKLKHIASINKDIVEASAVNANNNTYEKVSMWKSDWPQEITDGMVIKAEVKETEKNGYKNFTLYPERTNTLNKPTRSAGAITKAMETKAANIEHAQDNKERSIKVSSTFRDATLITTARMSKGDYTPEQVEVEWLKWRTWLWRHYDDDQPPF